MFLEAQTTYNIRHIVKQKAWRWPGFLLYSGIVIEGEDYIVKPGSDAWGIFEQVLALKISDGKGTEQNKKDLEEMKKIDENGKQK